MMIDMTRLHKLACTAANAAVPDFESNRHAWIAAYDAEFAILLLMPGSVL